MSHAFLSLLFFQPNSTLLSLTEASQIRFINCIQYQLDSTQFSCVWAPFPLSDVYTVAVSDSEGNELIRGEARQEYSHFEGSGLMLGMSYYVKVGSATQSIFLRGSDIFLLTSQILQINIWFQRTSRVSIGPSFRTWTAGYLLVEADFVCTWRLEAAWCWSLKYRRVWSKLCGWLDLVRRVAGVLPSQIWLLHRLVRCPSGHSTSRHPQRWAARQLPAPALCLRLVHASCQQRQRATCSRIWVGPCASFQFLRATR